MAKKNDVGVPPRKASRSRVPSKSSPKKAPGFPSTRSRGDHPPMYAVRWNKLISIVQDLVVAQATFERSPHQWAQDRINELHDLLDRDALGSRKATPTKSKR